MLTEYCVQCGVALPPKGGFCGKCGMPRTREDAADMIDRMLLEPSDPPTWPGKVILGTIGMLLWALLPFNPYSYYVLLRWVVCVVCIWQFTILRRERIWGSALIFAAVSLLYNPLMAFRFERSTWAALNLATLGMLVALPFLYGRALRRR